MPIIKILPEKFIVEFNEPPKLSSAERLRYSYIPSAIIKRVNRIVSEDNRFGFLMQYFYFRITERFYPIENFNTKDCSAIAKRYNLENYNLENYSSSTFYRHQDTLCEELNFRRFNETVKTELIEISKFLCEKQVRPRKILKVLVDYLSANRIEGTSYYPLVKIISESLNSYQNELVSTLYSALDTEQKKDLDRLLVPVDDDKNSEITLLTSLSKFNHSRAPGGIRDNCTKLSNILDLLKPYLETAPVKLSKEAIEYYAGVTLSFDPHQLSRRDESRYLYLYAFLKHQLYSFQDTLIDTILLTCQGRETVWVKRKKEELYNSYKEQTQWTQSVSKTVAEQKQFIETFLSIIDNSSLETISKLDKLTVLATSIQSKNSAKEKIVPDKTVIEQPLEKDRFHYEESDSRFLQHRITAPLKLLMFDPHSSTKNLFDAVSFFKSKDGAVSGTAPVDFLSQDEQDALWDGEKFRVSLYKVLLFRAVIKGVKSGTLNLLNSYKYQSFESYLISLEQWNCNKETLIKKAGLEEYKSPTALLDSLKLELSTQKENTENSLSSGDNKFVRFDKKNKPIITTPPAVSERENILGDQFPQHSSVSLFQILSTVNEQSNFTGYLEHQYQKNSKKSPSLTALIASVIGYGCNIGIPQMSHMVKNISKEDFEYAAQWHLSQENLENANNAILTLTENLLLTNLYKKDVNKTHTSSDGQKFAVTINSLHASYSHKYFGTQKGVSVYSFIDESHKLSHSTVMIPSEREAAYVIDGLLANDVVKSDIHSTDTHGYSEIIFAVTHLIGVSFAPRIKSVKNQRLYSFETPSEANREGWKLLSSGRINTELIEEQWDAILRFIVTLKLKETTASQLFKRLNSYSRQHPLYRALKQFGRIIKSIFILRYIDDTELRQSIEKQLNRIESYHQFAKAISFARNQELNYATKEEQLIAEGCKRLIANAIIYWNYLYISKKLCKATSEEERKGIINAVRTGSMVSWQHINFQGEYDFSEKRLKDAITFDLEEIASLQIEELL